MKDMQEIIDSQETQVPKLKLDIKTESDFNLICQCTGYSIDTLRRFDRTTKPVFARYAIWNYFYENKYDYPELGVIFNRDRNTIRAGIKTYNLLLSIRDQRALEINSKFKSNLQQLYSSAIQIFMSNDFNIE